VRLEAVRALVSLAEPGLVASAAGDASREVRVAVAEGLATIGGSQATPALSGLISDRGPLVRAAALTAAGAAGCPPPLDALAADPHADVRKAAVMGLAAWAARPAAQQALRTAATDADADVRAYARQALAP
jgi:HEAT repeat protein